MKDSSSADRDQAIRPQQVQRGSSTDVIWIDNDLLPIERERERERERGGGERLPIDRRRYSSIGKFVRRVR